ncbi:MAG: hypothetical protein H0W73_12185 [Bacteroidetes bacterium]|nr:hypothetical protein [Bacteroidota bacterium]
MEKDKHIEINADLLMEHAEKIIHDLGLGTVSNISQLVEEIKIGEKIYELRLELKLKEIEKPSDDIIA